MANPHARGQQRDKPFRDALRLEIAAAQDADDLRSLRRIAKAFLTKCAEGDVPAIKELADRLDGKVPQAIVGDDAEAPITVQSSEEANLETARRIAFLLAKAAATQSE